MNPLPKDRLHRRLPWILLLATAISGCSKPSPPSTPSPAIVAPNATGDSPRLLAMARGKVEVRGGLLDVVSPLNGEIETLDVGEGDLVQRGQVLLKLASEQARMEADLAQADLQLVQARKHAQAARLPAARQLARRMDEAARAGALDPQRTEEALQAQRDIEAAMRVLEAEIAIARQKVDLARLAVRHHTITAPHDAIVLKLNVQAGARVAAQGAPPLMVLMPQRALIVRAELNESYVASVKPGMRATIQIERDAHDGAEPAQVAAHVLRLSAAYGPSRLDDETPQRTGLRVVDCILELDPAAASRLRPGRNVRVSFYE
ncbi:MULTISPECIES: HlyD family secretion protein [unclassified Variovorax]|uniref:HlyD family secretion protein n=1 Tax=unclassified Variovorax TaxID=663243 RepID=UPI003F46912E